MYRLTSVFASISLALLSNFSTLSPSISTASFPEALKVATLDLASKHLVCSVALTGVMVFQAGRWWAERDDEDEEESLRGEESRSDSKFPSEAVTPEIPEKTSVAEAVEMTKEEKLKGSLKSKRR